jgi:predicted signal transduction protein with EAL and GGDEF domain
MNKVTPLQVSRKSLVDHLEARLADGDIERALGGFALLLIKFYDGEENIPTPDAADKTEILNAISARLRTTLRDSDFLAQFDERSFAVVIPQISDRATAERIIQKLRTAFLLPLVNNNGAQASVLSPKFGFSLFPTDGATQQALIAHAEKLT